MPKTSTPEQQATRRKLIIAIQRLKSLDDLKLALTLIEMVQSNPQKLESIMEDS